MSIHPTDEVPPKSFSQVKDGERGKRLAETAGEEPVVSNVRCFRLALSSKGRQLGWLGEDNFEWAMHVTDPQRALVLESFLWNGITYYRIKETHRYLSVALGDWAGFYSWSGATGFTREGSNLKSDYNQGMAAHHPKTQYLACREDGDEYGYEALDVTFEMIAQPLTPLIEHIVVVMLENRSFDNMLGGLYPEKSRDGTYRGLKGDESNPDPKDGKPLTVFHGPPNEQTWTMPYPDPGELFTDMNEQIFGTPDPPAGAQPTMQGFAKNYSKQSGAPLEKGGPEIKPDPRNIMQYYDETLIPITSYLAKQYAVCDGWYASAPAQTLSNRMFAHCGTPGHVPGTNNARINNPDFTKGFFPKMEGPVEDTTVFELLDRAYSEENNWRVYYHDAPISALCKYVYNSWSLFPGLGRVVPFKMKVGGTNFEWDIMNGHLPKYSFIEPCYENFFGGTVNSNHPGGAGLNMWDPNGDALPPPISIKNGEAFLAEVYSILEKYPETFKKTLLIVTYDEHGGLFDHVKPPAAVSPFEKKPDNFAYDRYGVRVPAILINPCIPPGTIYPPRVVENQWHFDHTSLISTVMAQFGLTGALTPRSAAAPALRGLIPPEQTVYPRPPLPNLPHLVARESAEEDAPAPQIDLEVAMAVIDQQENPHALAHALLPLIARAQQLAEAQE